MANDKEEQAKAWEAYVTREVNAYLESFLGDAISGNVGIKYVKPVASKSETGVKYKEDKAIGAKLMVVLQFENEIDIPKEEE